MRITIDELRRLQRRRADMLSYYKRWLITGFGHSYLLNMIEEEFPVETTHLQLGVWIRRKLHLL